MAVEKMRPQPIVSYIADLPAESAHAGTGSGRKLGLGSGLEVGV